MYGFCIYTLIHCHSVSNISLQLVNKCCIQVMHILFLIFSVLHNKREHKHINTHGMLYI